MGSDNFASLMKNAGGVDRARRRLKSGEVLDATVIQVASDFVFVDVGTPSDGRIPRLELIDSQGLVRVKEGDQIRVSVIEARSDGPLLKALGQTAPPGEAPQPDEVLKAKVSRIEKFGLFITTPKGDGLVPLRELPLPPGSDHRRLFPVGKELDVVVIDANAQGKLRFSATRVARVEEERSFRDFAAASKDAAEKSDAEVGKQSKSASGFGSLGDLLREKLGKSLPAAPAPAATQKPAAAATQKPAPAAAAATKAEPPKNPPAASAPAKPPSSSRDDVIRRKR
ncbi:MAG TPA: S1 RNA-binding domain-containing protein [Polyangiaceae bacterium]|jgi:ribosomal protein S1